MTEKLKPCPFCGEKVKVDVPQSFSEFKRVFCPNFFCPNCGANNLWGKYAIKLWNNRKKIKRCPICGAKGLIYETYDGTWVVQCSKCFLTTPYKLTREEAIKAWNRRVNNDIRGSEKTNPKREI